MTSVQGFNCVFCKEIFYNKEDLQIHFRKHGDPNFNQNKTIKRSTSESEDSPKPINDQELVGCDVCTEVFPTISRAITHKHKVHPDHDAKYFCPWCGKLFTLKHLYNKHLESNHGETEEIIQKLFHCDACDIDFNVPSGMIYHNKFFHRQDTDIPDLGQSSKLRAYSQTSIPIYYCAFCGEEYENKVNLHKHILDEHSDENQSPQEVLRCPLCQAVFFHLDAYELHLTFHSPNDLYSATNEIACDLSDYSLDTVPPMLEKVEDCQALQAAETTVQEMDINDLLELAMEESQGSKKSKKHKKHKKSKRSAITLDEFLNMNKDVFGEGIDVQGVEEVPTRAITKRLKVVNKPSSVHNLELEKLKKQGIVIKKKPNKHPNAVSNFKVPKTKIPVLKNTFIQAKAFSEETPKMCSSQEVLSKLINQKNNQLKIVKKTCTEISNGAQNIQNKTEDLSENLQMECDSTKVIEGAESYESENNDAIENDLLANENIDSLQQSENSEIDEATEPKINSTEELENFLATNSDDEMNNDSSNVQQSPEATVSESELKKNIQDHRISPSIDSVTIKSISKCPVVLETNPSKSNNITTKIDTLEPKSVINTNEHDNIANTKQVENNTENSLEALKYLSHLTIKSVNNSKNISINQVNIPEPFKTPEAPNKNVEHGNNNGNEPVENDLHSSLEAVKHISGIIVKSDNPPNSADEMLANADDQNDFIEDEENINTYTSMHRTSVHSSQNKPTLNKCPQINNMKLGQNITIKSLKHSKTDKDTDSETEMNNSDFSNAEDEDFEPESNATDVSETQTRRKILNYPSNKTLPNIKNVQSTITEKAKHKSVETKFSNENVKRPNESADLLKHLKHITAKPIHKVKNNTNQTVINKTLTQNIKKPVIKVERNEDNIEIFNIDDSDSDDMENTKTEIKPLAEIKQIEALKHLSNTVTIKSLKNTDPPKLQDECKKIPEDYQESASQREKDGINPKLEAIKKSLKNLGNNITVKSRTSSPSQSQTQVQNKNVQEQKYDSNEESDSNSEFNRVKITEVDDEEEDINDETKNDNNHCNVIVQAPDDSGSDNEFNTNEDYEENEDFETPIESNTIHKANQSDSMSTSDYAKKFGKNVTIKCNNKIPNVGGAPNISQSGPVAQSSKTSAVLQRPNTIKGVNIGRTVNQAMKQVTSSNQVNKEVTVQRYQTQTKTVIQEITTTVTKTIKTVNQEVRNTQDFKNQSRPTFTPQKVKGMNVNSPKNLEGVVVKQSAPNQIIKNAPVRPPVRKTMRPSNELVPVNTSFRPSNQLVPVRPNLRLPSPRMPNRVRPSAPVMQGPRVGKQLKISPTAVIKSKRPNSEQPSGHFSCFKKPKESLFPIHDGSSQFNQNEDGNVEFASSSQVTKNFMSASKSVKGNSMVASMQMKSETSTSSYEINKLSNMSGLKVTKMSQSKQVTEDHSQVDATKRTIDAIQKLQKQGLLVKKPKLDNDVPFNEDSDNSEGAGDDNVDYSSADE